MVHSDISKTSFGHSFSFKMLITLFSYTVYVFLSLFVLSAEKPLLRSFFRHLVIKISRKKEISFFFSRRKREKSTSVLHRTPDLNPLNRREFRRFPDHSQKRRTHRETTPLVRPNKVLPMKKGREPVCPFLKRGHKWQSWTLNTPFRTSTLGVFLSLKGNLTCGS